jgi:predicted Zn-ribbon and HTH transcriptional regulator
MEMLSNTIQTPEVTALSCAICYKKYKKNGKYYYLITPCCRHWVCQFCQLRTESIGAAQRCPVCRTEAEPVILYDENDLSSDDDFSGDEMDI